MEGKNIDHVSKEIRPTASRLQEIVSKDISLIDFDTVIRFTSELLKQWKNVSSSIRIGEDSFAMSSNPFDVKEVVDGVGGVSLVDYVSVVSPSIFSINADFARNKLVIRTDTKDLLRKLISQYDDIKKADTPLSEVSVSFLNRDAKKFLVSMVNLDGSINEGPRQKLTFDKSYVLSVLPRLDLSSITNSFGEYIIRKQKDNGSCADPNAKRTDLLLNTANAILVLSGASLANDRKQLDAIKKGISFILKRYNRKSGIWSSAKTNREFLTAMCYIALVSAGNHDVTDKTKARIEKWIMSRTSQLDPILLDLIPQEHSNSLQNLLKRIIQDYYSNSDKKSHDARQLALYLYSSIKLKDAGINTKEIISELHRIMTKDHGWASNKERTSGEFSTTTTVLYALNLAMNSPSQVNPISSSIIEASNRYMSELEKKEEEDEKEHPTA